ncbi:DUF6262 family protein [Aciduricibacillus chroicocephali]|uniref:DUF6262 family protein n=1 Tax=Aciduricibacillus chroicocephali TaxID=3054939 RepID=A0ABY9KY87_9BACI|nr:DUF6262 family protein [Bacillaceae bacterium 44XB]WLV25851.1 DUF6262 family protein [Bacillaceae bacterium 44XB]
MANKSPNTNKIIELARLKSHETEKKVFNAIKAMIKNKEKINYNSVSIKSNVSKSFLYKNSSIRGKIDMLRGEQLKLEKVTNHKPNTSDKSKDVIIETLKGKIENLIKENESLKEALASKYNNFYNNL